MGQPVESSGRFTVLYTDSTAASGRSRFGSLSDAAASASGLIRFDNGSTDPCEVGCFEYQISLYG